MRLASFIAPAVGGILVLGPGSGLLAQSRGERAGGWYVGGGRWTCPVCTVPVALSTRSRLSGGMGRWGARWRRWGLLASEYRKHPFEARHAFA